MQDHEYFSVQPLFTFPLGENPDNEKSTPANKFHLTGAGGSPAAMLYPEHPESS